VTNPIRVAVLAGRRRSPASLLMLETLSRLRPRVEVAAVLAVSEFRWRRMRDWYLRFGAQALWRGLRELGLKTASANQEETVLCEELARATVLAKSLPEICRRLDVPFHLVTDINSPPALQILKRYCCDYGIYSGAGILRTPLLDCFAQGVLNLHCGSLPAIRGMNGVEWSLFCGRPPEATLHLIDAGIDTGPILAARTIDPEPGDSLSRLRGRTIVAGIELLAECLPRIDSLPRCANPLASGRQYFAMASTLKVLVEDRLKVA
jgi:hypothetical protein